MSIWEIIGIIAAVLVVLFIVYFIVDANKNAKAEKEFLDNLKESHGFDIAYQITGTNAQKVKGILLDNSAQKIALVKNNVIQMRPFNDLISFEIITDVKTETETKGTSQDGLFSNTAVHKGTTTTMTVTTSVKIKIIFDDLDNPSYELDLIKELYMSEKKAIDEASKINDYLSVIVHRNQQKLAK
ncbi:MAG: hypothetical protein LBB59_06970 [Campylobacteraceae bacterium]|jgi:hypothetical protein|nr:hypothetical protein [Campylobacteraceae bacterium]